MLQKAILAEHLSHLPITSDNGTGWYKWLFTAAPDARKFFAGAHEIDPEKVLISERFQKQGLRFLTEMHKWVDNCDNEAEFQKLVADLTISHTKRFKIAYDWYPALGGVFMGYLESKCGMTTEQKAAWDQLFAKMSEIAKPLAFQAA